MKYIPTTEPFFFPGGKTGCLLVHGFTGTPKEMRPLGEHLAGMGYSVLGVRLFGHSTQPEDMMRARWWDWLMSVEDGWQYLSGSADQIFLVGLSMGGALCLLSATRLPAVGVIAMSTPCRLPVKNPVLVKMQGLPPQTRAWMLRALSLVMRYEKKPPRLHPPTGLMLDHLSYPQNPMRAIAELVFLLEHTCQQLPEIKIPALLIHSKADNNVPYSHMQHIYNRLGTQDKQMVTLESSGHVITRDNEHEIVFEAVGAFIQRVSAGVNNRN